MGRITISQTKRQIIFARDAWRCCYCGEEATLEVTQCKRPHRLKIVPLGSDGRMFEIDHVRPVKDGIDNSFDNLVTACWRCNNSKSGRLKRPVYQFYRVKING